MNGFASASLFIILGAVGYIAYQQVHMTIRQRVNYGKRVYVNRRHAGYVVSCRFNGSKKYFFVNEFYELDTKQYSDKRDAYKACQDAFLKDRPKQIQFARAV